MYLLYTEHWSCVYDIYNSSRNVVHLLKLLFAVQTEKWIKIYFIYTQHTVLFLQWLNMRCFEMVWAEPFAHKVPLFTRPFVFNSVVPIPHLSRGLNMVTQ